MSNSNSLTEQFKSEVKSFYYSIYDLDQFSALLTKIEIDHFFKDQKDKPSPLTRAHLHAISKKSNSLYTCFEIPKSNGDYRKIEAPDHELIRLQRLINVLFQILFEEKASYHSNGFILNRNIIRNARPHINKKFLLNLDIENFFPSIDFRRIKTVLEFAPFNLKGEREYIGFILANICCFHGRLPQGAPTSPILSNIVTQRLDRRISNFAYHQKVKYTRYADDISFSSNKEVFDYNFINSISEIIQSENFILNQSKTRIKTSRDRQEVTGIIVNQKLNINRQYIKTIRTMLHNWEQRGIQYATNKFYSNEVEKIGYDFVHVLEGRLSHLRAIRGKDDPLSSKMLNKLKLLKNTIDYSNISNERVKEKLISDNRKMERILFDTLHESDDKFISYCTSGFHQIENLLNYFYHQKFPIFKDLLLFLLDHNPAFKKKHKTLEKCGSYTSIKDLNINLLVYLFEKEFFFDKGRSYKQELTMLRDIRNDESHRCQVVHFNQEEVITTYNELEKKWKRFRKKKGRDPVKPENEKEAEYKFRLLAFLKEKKYRRVRETVKMVSDLIQNYNFDQKSHLSHNVSTK